MLWRCCPNRPDTKPEVAELLRDQHVSGACVVIIGGGPGHGGPSPRARGGAASPPELPKGVLTSLGSTRSSLARTGRRGASVEYGERGCRFQRTPSAARCASVGRSAGADLAPRAGTRARGLRESASPGSTKARPEAARRGRRTWHAMRLEKRAAAGADLPAPSDTHWRAQRSRSTTGSNAPRLPPEPVEALPRADEDHAGTRSPSASRSAAAT